LRLHGLEKGWLDLESYDTVEHIETVAGAGRFPKGLISQVYVLRKLKLDTQSWLSYFEGVQPEVSPQ
jgi:hypothetical protein